MDTDHVKALLHCYLEEEGTNGLAKRLGVSRQHIWAILSGVSKPGKALLTVLGLEAKVEIVKPKHLGSYDRKQYLRAANKAYSLVNRAVKNGRLPNLRKQCIMCVDCGVLRANAYDHRDYSNPLDVSPVCARCNWKRGPAEY